MRAKVDVPPTRTGKSWLKLSLDVQPPVKSRRGDRMRWKGTLVLAGIISGHDVNVPIADCRAELEMRPPPVAREVLLGLLRTALGDSRSRIPDRLQDALLAARAHLEHVDRLGSSRTPPARTRPRAKRLRMRARRRA